ncbi:MAG TPA: PKD domain-containing protein, partial [Saprospiraceae bacterium]|nr:PKD domain-containing protein [Saprospiraceae bacterium]
NRYFYQQRSKPLRNDYTNGIRYLHVIDQPDEAGTACGFRQQGIELPTVNQSSIPNFPNYRLGPLDGSPCDTLGLDNRPVAWYRYASDTLNRLKVAFHDLSYYEPTAWAWDFGDGQKSTERYPTHHFDTAGVYQVCLTVSNANSSSTHCKTLQISTSATDDPALQSQIEVLPNPFAERLAVLWSAELPGAAFHLYDLTGNVVRTAPIALGVNELDTESLLPGAYFWAVVAGGLRLKGGKVMKLR